MSMSQIHDLPLGLFAVGTIGTFVLLSVLGLWATRPLVARLVGPPPGANDVVSYYFGAIGVLYGLTVGLIAITTWQAYTSAEQAVSSEAAALAAVYLGVSGYPDKDREPLQAELKEYTRCVIEEAWPLQRRGEVPRADTDRIARFRGHLAKFEPATPGQQALHAETLHSFHRLAELRRVRLLTVTAGVPPALWWVVLVGSVLTAASGFLFHLPRLRVHLALTAVMTAHMGLLVFLIAAMDRPYSGGVSIGPDAFQLVYDGLMKD